MSKIIGIDLGTGNSAVAVMEGGTPVIIVNSEGGRTTPSVVSFRDGERKVGSSAKRQSITNPKNTVYSIKRFMGETFEHVKKECKNVTYEVNNDLSIPRVSIDGKFYTPQEISSMILQAMKKNAEDYLGEEVKDAVITVPAYFSDSQRQATKEAGEIAGLNVRRIINEPTAAALAYGLDKKSGNSKIAVFDLGQGTFDISILDLGDGVFEVLSTNGDTHLGGDDFDQKIIDWVVNEFRGENNGFDLTGDPIAMQRIKEATEKAKIELSNTATTEINLPYITAINGLPVHFVKTITRAKFEQLVFELVEKTVEPCKKAISDAGLDVNEINEVILVGGSTRIPLVQETVKKIFGKEPNKGVNPDEVVAMGAAIQGGVLAGEVNDVLLLDVTPLNLGIETMGGVMHTLIEANTTIPTRKSEIFTTAADNQPGVEINVLQGNRPMANDNKQIGIFHLDGIMPAMRGVPQIEVTFDIDSNGIMSVSAIDKATGKEQKIRIESKTGISQEEIEKMKSDAEKYAEEDKKKREEINTINEADAFAFQIEKAITDLGDKISENDKTELDSKISALRDSVSNRDIGEAKRRKKELEDKWYSLTSQFYGNQGNDGSMNNPFDTFEQATNVNFEGI